LAASYLSQWTTFHDRPSPASLGEFLAREQNPVPDKAQVRLRCTLPESLLARLKARLRLPPPATERSLLRPQLIHPQQHPQPLQVPAPDQPPFPAKVKPKLLAALRALLQAPLLVPLLVPQHALVLSLHLGPQQAALFLPPRVSPKTDLETTKARKTRNKRVQDTTNLLHSASWLNIGSRVSGSACLLFDSRYPVRFLTSAL
jgi:hypothetical protein